MRAHDWTYCAAFVFCFASVACGDDSDDGSKATGGTSGSGGQTGKGGSANSGTGGKAASGGGSGGSAGTPTGGAAGSAAGGSAGTASGGAAGNPVGGSGGNGVGGGASGGTGGASSACTAGVDCYCDLNPQLLLCEDFSAGNFGITSGTCVNQSGTWPTCQYVRFDAINTGGYASASAGINDHGAIKMTLLGQLPSQTGMPLFHSGTLGIAANQEVHYGVMMYAGPDFWRAFSTGAFKFIAFIPNGQDPRQVVYWRPASNNGPCASPDTYGVPTASGGGGAAQPADEFGNYNPFDSSCQHTIKFGNNLANQWVYIEWRSRPAGQKNSLHVWDQAGNQMIAEKTVTARSDIQRVELFHWNEDGPVQAPTNGSWLIIDFIRASTTPMGPPPGFITP